MLLARLFLYLLVLGCRGIPGVAVAACPCKPGKPLNTTLEVLI